MPDSYIPMTELLPLTGYTDGLLHGALISWRGKTDAVIYPLPEVMCRLGAVEWSTETTEHCICNLEDQRAHNLPNRENTFHPLLLRNFFKLRRDQPASEPTNGRRKSPTEIWFRNPVEMTSRRLASNLSCLGSYSQLKSQLKSCLSCTPA